MADGLEPLPRCMSLTPKDVDEVRNLLHQCSPVKTLDAYVVKGTPGQRQIAPISQAKAFFEAVPDAEVR